MDKRLREVVEAARAKTERDEQDWEPFGEEAYRARVGTGTINIGRVAEPEDGRPGAQRTYVVSVYDRMGRTAATAEVAPFDSVVDYAAIEGLYDAAQESVSRPRRVLDEMLQVLRR